eukprot:2417826-Amphidinium_carterae.2
MLEKCKRPVGIGSEMYFMATGEDLLSEQMEMMQKKSLPMHAKRKRYPTRELLPAGALDRLILFEKQWESLRIQALQEGRPIPKGTFYYASLSQNPAFYNKAATVIPPLIKNTLLWSERHSRTMTAREHFAVQGWPAYKSRGLLWDACPLKRLMQPDVDDGTTYLSNLSSAALRALAGNSMHLGVVSQILFAVLFAL